MSTRVPLSIQLTVPFEPHLHADFLRRIQKCGNLKAIKFLESADVERHGATCKVCNETKPFYSYQQNKNCKNGINVTKCNKCYVSSRCPWEVMLRSMKSTSKRRGHPPPEYTVEDLKELWETQHGRCLISNILMRMKHGDNDPFNMSPERLENTKGYVKGNVVLICQWLQIGGVHDYLPTEIRSWFQYDMAGDFVFDPTIFDKQVVVSRKYRRAVKKYDDMGVLVSRTCTDCGVDKGVGYFIGKLSYCKVCNNIRNNNYFNTPRGFVMKMAVDAKSSTKKRGAKRKRNDDSDVSVDDIFKLAVSTIKRQGGRCAVTGIPFVYQRGHKFAPSLDRIDNTKGYIDGNVEVIISPLNTQNKPLNDGIRKLIKNQNLF